MLSRLKSFFSSAPTAPTGPVFAPVISYRDLGPTVHHDYLEALHFLLTQLQGAENHPSKPCKENGFVHITWAVKEVDLHDPLGTRPVIVPTVTVLGPTESISQKAGYIAIDPTDLSKKVDRKFFVYAEEGANFIRKGEDTIAEQRNLLLLLASAEYAAKTKVVNEQQSAWLRIKEEIEWNTHIGPTVKRPGRESMTWSKKTVHVNGSHLNLFCGYSIDDLRKEVNLEILLEVYSKTLNRERFTIDTSSRDLNTAIPFVKDSDYVITGEHSSAFTKMFRTTLISLDQLAEGTAVLLASQELFSNVLTEKHYKIAFGIGIIPPAKTKNQPAHNIQPYLLITDRENKPLARIVLGPQTVEEKDHNIKTLAIEIPSTTEVAQGKPVFERKYRTPYGVTYSGNEHLGDLFFASEIGTVLVEISEKSLQSSDFRNLPHLHTAPARDVLKRRGGFSP